MLVSGPCETEYPLPCLVTWNNRRQLSADVPVTEELCLRFTRILASVARPEGLSISRGALYKGWLPYDFNITEAAFAEKKGTR